MPRASNAHRATTLYFVFALALSLSPVPLTLAASAQATQEATAANSAPSASAAVVPQQVRYAGELPAREGDTVEAVFRIYSTQEGGEPLWTETQHIAVGQDGAYTVLLGSATAAGLPQSVFAGGAARWLGVSVERGPENERTLLSSVPYAMKSADAQLLEGHAASDFVTQSQLAALSGQPGTAPQPETGGDVTGSGTTNTVPLWTSSSTIGNSVITQSGKFIGIDQAAPASALDVNGSVTVRGDLNLPAPTKATATKGQPSNLFEFSSSAWNSSSSAAQGETFFMVADPTGNNTASPSAVLNFQFKNGSAAPATVFSVAGNGVMTFSPSQTFPGTITSITGASPITATTTSGAVNVGLDSTALETALNAVYPQLAAGNIFQSYLVAQASDGAGDAAILGFGTSQTMGVYGNSDTGFGVYGDSDSPVNGNSGVLGNTGGAFTFSKTYTNLGTTVANEVAGVWGDTLGNPNTGSGFFWSAGILGTADNNNAGAFYNNSDGNFYTVYAENLGTGPTFGAVATSGAAVEATSSTGNGVAGVARGSGHAGTSLDGVSGFSAAPSSGSAGAFGQTYASSVTYSAVVAQVGITAGAWGDGANVNDGSSNLGVGVAGTADNSSAGYFLNSSAELSTVIAINLNSGGTNGLFKTFKAYTERGTCGIGDGDLSCTGQVKSLVSTGGGARTVETYATQSAENWMEDYGSGSLEKGVAVVKIDPAFAETVSETPNYHVFLTPNGDSKGLYVINKTATSFEVRESGGGTSSLLFDYKIVAKRRGYEAQRLVDVTERFNAEQNGTLTRLPRSSPAAAHAAPPVHPMHQSHPVHNGPLPGEEPQHSPSAAPVRHAPGGHGNIFGNGVATVTHP